MEQQYWPPRDTMEAALMVEARMGQRELDELKSLVRELLDILDETEVSDGEEHVFHPTTISSCRTVQCERLNVILPRMKELVKQEK